MNELLDWLLDLKYNIDNITQLSPWHQSASEVYLSKTFNLSLLQQCWFFNLDVHSSDSFAIMPYAKTVFVLLNKSYVIKYLW